MARDCVDIMLTFKWGQNILKLLNWVKICNTTAKREMNPALY